MTIKLPHKLTDAINEWLFFDSAQKDISCPFTTAPPKSERAHGIHLGDVYWPLCSYIFPEMGYNKNNPSLMHSSYCELKGTECPCNHSLIGQKEAERRLTNILKENEHAAANNREE